MTPKIIPNDLQQLIDESPKLQQALANGIDLVELWENLKLTPTERLEKMQRRLAELEASGIQIDPSGLTK
jgi:hypothetical protein